MKCLSGLLVVALCSFGALAAQDDPPRQRPPMGPMGPGPGGGGGATMIAHDGFIFIFAGGTLYKVDPASMKVVGELQVVKGQPGIRPPRPDGERQPRPPEPPPPPGNK
jgi:hypothetical protein